MATLTFDTNRTTKTGAYWSATALENLPATDRDSQRCEIAPADGYLAAQFAPPDPGVVSEAIPAFFIGRNREGFWVAREVRGRVGGIFLLKSSALSFAKCNSEPAGCAMIFPSESFELDLENSGNPAVVSLGSLKYLVMRAGQRMAGLIGKIAAAVKTPIAGFLRRLN